jgi:hypothetical protein
MFPIFKQRRRTLAILVVLACRTLTLSATPNAGSDPSLFGEFIGTTPCGQPIRQLLGLSSDIEPEIMEWKLTFYQDPKTDAPSRYDFRCEYGLTAPNKPGIAIKIKTLHRHGSWSMGKGIKSNPNSIVYELHGAISFFQVDSNVLHVLNSDRTLMLGTSGWSYTLSRTERAEKLVKPGLAQSQPEMSYQISALATGPTLFAVFEGRTPCQGIARELKIPVHAASTKTKWRVTLYQNPETRQPTTYKVEGSLHRREARQGNWTITRGTQNDSESLVYRLAATESEPALLLLKGDDDVLFFLDQSLNPLVGNAQFSYTLNRRIGFSPASQPVRIENQPGLSRP